MRCFWGGSTYELHQITPNKVFFLAVEFFRIQRLKPVDPSMPTIFSQFILAKGLTKEAGPAPPVVLMDLKETSGVMPAESCKYIMVIMGNPGT